MIERSAFSYQRSVVAAAAVLALSSPLTARADMFGGDVSVLTSILANEITQVVQMGEQVQNAIAMIKLLKEQIDTARSVYAGIEDLKDLTWEDLKDDIVEGSKDGFYKAYPGLDDVVEDATNYETVFDPSKGNGSWQTHQRIRSYVINAYGHIPEVGPKLSRQLLPEVASRQEIEIALQRAKENLRLSDEKYWKIIERLEKSSENMSPGQAQILAAKAAAFQARQMQGMTDTMSELLRLEALRLGNESAERTRNIRATVRYLKDVAQLGGDPMGLEIKEPPSVEEVLRREVPLGNR